MFVHRINLSIPAERYVALYGGKVKNVSAISEQGLRVEFPGSILTQFVSREGVHGRFEISVDSENKLSSIKRLS